MFTTYLILIAFIIGFIGFYMLATTLNSKVPIPESCKAAYLEAQTCESCSSRSGGCGFSDAIEFMKEVKL